MTKNSESAELVRVMANVVPVRHRLSVTQLRLRVAAGILALLNVIALYFYISPPGGTRQDLELQSIQVRTQIRAAQMQAAKSHGLADHLQTASEQTNAFSEKYFLPKRNATVSIFEEIQRMAKASGIQERDAGWTEEPIEGSPDLSLFTITANYEGTNANLMKFLYEADHSPMLLILDAMQASPQQRNNQINTSIRFQAIVREPITAPPPVGAQPAGGAQ